MIDKVFVNTDGSVDVYDYEGCKVPHLCGDLTILHYIYKNFTADHPAQTVLDEDRCERAKFYIHSNVENTIIALPPSHLARMLKYINNPNNQ